MAISEKVESGIKDAYKGAFGSLDSLQAISFNEVANHYEVVRTDGRKIILSRKDVDDEMWPQIELKFKNRNRWRP